MWLFGFCHPFLLTHIHRTSTRLPAGDFTGLENKEIKTGGKRCRKGWVSHCQRLVEQNTLGFTIISKDRLMGFGGFEPRRGRWVQSRRTIG